MLAGRKIALFWLLAFTPSLTVASGHREKQWLYVNPESPFLVVLGERSYMDGMDKTHAKTCPKSSAYYCFENDFFNFYIPRDLQKNETWTMRGMTYCIRQRWQNDQGNDLFQIYGYHNNSTCAPTREAPSTKMIYSPDTGLRYLEISSTGGAKVIRILASDNFGFARPDGKSKVVKVVDKAQGTHQTDNP